MNVNELTQKHIRERAMLEQQIAQLEQGVRSEPSRLEKRAKEIEIEKLKAQLAHVKARQAIEPMVIGLLEEVAIAKKLRPSAKKALTRSVPYEQEREVEVTERKWIFKTTRKTKTKQTQYRTETYYENVASAGDVKVVQETPDSWSITGRVSVTNGCSVTYTIAFRDTSLLVSAKSDASWEERYVREEGVSRSGPIGPSEMKGDSWSCGLSERELVDLLRVHVLSPNRLDVCPCTYSIACPCACARDWGWAHPFGVCNMPSLWDPCATEPHVTPGHTEIGRPSAYLRTIAAGDDVIVYHSLLGNLRYAEPAILDFFALSEEGLTLEALKPRFPELDLEHEVQVLHEIGFFVVGDEEEQLQSKIRRREEAYSQGEMVRWLRLNTATGCNLACTYCHGVNEAPHDGSTLMPPEVASRAIYAYLGLLLEHGRTLMQMRYFGGEPLLNWPVVRDSLNEAARLAERHAMSLSILLNTNAVLLTPALVDELSAHRNHLQAVVSLDGPAVAHDAARIQYGGQGTFASVLRGLDLLQQAKIPISISVTLGAHNEAHLRELVDLLLARGIDSMGIDPVRIVFEASAPDTLANALLDAIEYARPRGFHISGLWEGVCERLELGATGAFCGGSGVELSVLPSGEVYPCQSQPVRLGTLEDVETRALFKTEAYRQVTMRVVGNLAECRGCEIEGMCVGGCAADAYAACHDLYGRTRYCQFLREMVRHHLAYLGALARPRAIAH